MWRLSTLPATVVKAPARWAPKNLLAHRQQGLKVALRAPDHPVDSSTLDRLLEDRLLELRLDLLRQRPANSKIVEPPLALFTSSD